MKMKDKIRIGVSSCLVGEKVRWNGDHKQDKYVRQVLSKYFEYTPVCPEMEVGMGVPRETVALYGDIEKPRMISKKKLKLTGLSQWKNTLKIVLIPYTRMIFAGTFLKANRLHVGLAEFLFTLNLEATR
jgi:uncharacterized protein YbbK (DUF523 family)